MDNSTGNDDVAYAVLILVIGTALIAGIALLLVR